MCVTHLEFERDFEIMPITFKNFSSKFLTRSLLLTNAFVLASASLHAHANMGYILNQIVKEKEAQHDYQLKSMTELTTVSDFNPMSVIQDTFNQKIDHKNQNDTRTFQQRYFVSTQYAKNQNAPVFYYICGEAECRGISPSQSFVQEAKKYNAYIVAIEHRYYGKSQPFTELTVENLQYLNTDEVMADLANFQMYMMEKNNWHGPWIVLGGSYAGALAAYYRLTYPQLVVGALASSAPVEAKLEFTEYDANTTIVAGSECREAIRETTRYVESMLDNPLEMLRIKKLFHVEDMESNIAMLFLLSEFATEAIQYGQKESFCNALLSAPNKLEGFAKGALQIVNYLGLSALSFIAEGAISTKASDYSSGIGVRQWFWQTCTEYGYFYTANPNPELSTRSRLVDLDYFLNDCKVLFGIKNSVDTEKLNQKYYYQLLDLNRNPQASQIFFTNGSEDPWQYLSISSERGNTTNPLFSYMTIPGGAHCDDLRITTNSNVQKAQQKFDSLLNGWFNGS